MAEKKIPMRRCAGCNQSKPKKELIRIIRTPEGEVRMDTTGRQNGRGVYICPDAACLKKAHRSKGLQRSLKVPVPEELYEVLEKELSVLEKK